MAKRENVATISFNVSKTVNIGNFEAIKINYGESVTVDPTQSLEQQRKEMIASCYDVVKKETEIWHGLKKVQHVSSSKSMTTVKAKTS